MNLRLQNLSPPVYQRQATSRDEFALARLWRRAWSSANPAVRVVAPLTHWQERVRAEFGPPCVTLILERDQSLLGFMVLDPARNYLHQLFVAPQVQSQGLGGALVLEICLSHFPDGWTLHVATSNQRARQFYARCGLVEEEVDLNPQTGRERMLCRWTTLKH